MDIKHDHVTGFHNICYVFFAALFFLTMLNCSKAAEYTLSGPESVKPGQYVEITMSFSGEDTIAIYTVYYVSDNVETVTCYNVSPWNKFVTNGIDTNSAAVGDFEGYQNETWNPLTNESENVLVFGITISDDAEIGDTVEFKLKKAQYATISDYIDYIENNPNVNLNDKLELINLLTNLLKDASYATGNSLTFTIVNPKVIDDSTMEIPEIISVSSKSASSNEITWNTIDGYSGYRVYRKEGKNGKYSKIADIEDGAIGSYIDTTADSGVQYYYTVRGLKFNAYDGDYRLSGYKAGTCSLTCPTIKSIKSTSATNNEIKWNAVTGATGYKVYRKVSGGKYSCIATVTTNQYNDSSAVKGQTYTYTIRAVRVSDGVTDLSWYNGISSLGTPSSLSVTCTTATKNTISWEKVSGASSYNIYRSVSGGKYSLIGTSATTSYADSSDVKGKTYIYTVRAVNTKSGCSVMSWYNTGITSLKTPSFTVSSTGKGKNKLSWSAVSGANSYYIIYRKSGSGSFKKIGTTTSLTYTDKRAASGVKYTYAVRASRLTNLRRDLSFYNSKSVTTK